MCVGLYKMSTKREHKFIKFRSFIRVYSNLSFHDVYTYLLYMEYMFMSVLYMHICWTTKSLLFRSRICGQLRHLTWSTLILSSPRNGWPFIWQKRREKQSWSKYYSLDFDFSCTFFHGENTRHCVAYEISSPYLSLLKKKDFSLSERARDEERREERERAWYHLCSSEASSALPIIFFMAQWM